MPGRWRQGLRWAVWPLLTALVGAFLALILPLAFEAERRFAELRTAGGDNVYWTSAQIEVDVLQLWLSAQTALNDPGPAQLADLRIRFDILYGRANIVRRWVTGQDMAEFESAARNLPPMRDYLERYTPLVDGPEAALVAALPGLLADTERLHGETRAFALEVMHVFNAEADRKREEVAQLQRRFFWLAIGVLGLLAATALGLAWQILRQRRDQRQLEQARASAEAANRAKSAFLANMSHEIRTPLNGVLGMSEVLAGTPLNTAQREMLGTIRGSGEALLTIINDILDLARIESGKMTLDPEPFVPAELCRRIEALHGVAARKKGLTLEIRAGQDAHALRLGDPTRIGQILHNLVGNAIKFTDSGSVVLHIAGDGRRLRLMVEDSGIGMSADQLSRVFGEFEQADNSVTRRYGGSGLGLAIVRKLVELIGGTLHIDSRPGTGTRVAVTLEAPLTAALPAALPSGDEVAAPPDAAGLAGLRVLVAEDTATNRKILEIMLQDLGVRASFAEDGAQACALWQPGAFDVLLLDISMPVRDGFEALAEIEARARHHGVPCPPAVAATANVMADQIEDYRARGFRAVLGKPFRRADLVAVLAQVAPPQRTHPAPAPKTAHSAG